MKTKIAAVIFAVAAMLTPACEKHSWDETSQLFKGHGEHGDAHGQVDGHGHGEKKAEAHGGAAKH